MSGKDKWPYERDERKFAERELERKTEDKHARLAAEARNRLRLRHDRLIVGGRAHTSKRGLS